MAEGAADGVVFVGFESVCERGGIINLLIEIEAVEIVDDVSYEIAIEVGVLLLARVINFLFHHGETEDPVPKLHVAVAFVLHHVRSEATDVMHDLGPDGLSADHGLLHHGLDGLGRTLLFERLRLIFAHTVVVDDRRGIGVVVLYCPNVYLLKGVSSSGVAFDFDIHCSLGFKVYG